MEQCQILREYAQYVAKVREYARETELDVAVEQAVNDCIRIIFLQNFFGKNKSEVIAMSIFEYDKEEEEKKTSQSRIEAGREAGKKEIIQYMYSTGKYTLDEIAEILGLSIGEVRRNH